jgi:hypothetical protein
MERALRVDGMSALIEKALVSGVLLSVTVPLFFAAGAATGTHVPVAWLGTRWDARIPLVPAAVWPYVSWYIAPWLLLAAPRQDFRRIAGAIALAFAVCTLTYVVVPASLERPAVVGRTLSERALLLLYKYDPPWNIFPSFHAALCALLWRPVFGGPFARRVMPVWMSTICVACVLTKQHHLLDIVAGLLVGFVALAVATVAINRLDLASALPQSRANPACQ